MFFLFIDASGDTRIRRSLQDNGLYILSGVIVHEKNWKTIEENLSDLKRELLPELDPYDWELHAHPIWNSKGIFDNPDLHLNLERKKEIFSRFIKLVCESELVLINVTIFKDWLKEKYITPKAKEYSWTILIERFEHFLRDQPCETNNGLLFVDSDQKIPEQEIKEIVWKLVRKGSLWQKVYHVIEDPIFTKSHLRNMIQFADMISYIINKHYKKDKQFEDWFNSLIPKMYQPDGRLKDFGLKEFPTNCTN